jgi:hypothetical protein
MSAFRKPAAGAASSVNTNAAPAGTSILNNRYPNAFYLPE